jgi:hypothetical protein
VELVANGIKGGTAGNKGSATGAGVAGTSAGAAALGLLFFLVPLPPGFGLPIIEEIAPKIAPLQQQRKQMSKTHSQLGTYEPEEPE